MSRPWERIKIWRPLNGIGMDDITCHIALIGQQSTIIKLPLWVGFVETRLIEINLSETQSKTPTTAQYQLCLKLSTRHSFTTRKVRQCH